MAYLWSIDTNVTFNTEVCPQVPEATYTERVMEQPDLM
jgi:hypothetical protein